MIAAGAPAGAAEVERPREAEASRGGGVDACWGYFSDPVKVSGTLQYGGWTQCDDPQDLFLKIDLWEYFPAERIGQRWKLVDWGRNTRFGCLVNVVEDPECINNKDHRFKMQAWPTVNDVAMPQWGKYSDIFEMACKVPDA